MKGNATILASIIVMALVASAVGVGTQAWFSDTGTSSSNTFTTGTLILKLSNGPTWEEGVTATWTSPSNWAPSESFTSTLYLKNTGSIDAQVVYEDWTNLNDANGLSHWIQVTEISDSIPWVDGNNTPYGDNYVVNWITPAIDTNGDGKLSLYEFQSWGDRKVVSSTPKPWDGKITEFDDPALGHALPAGGTLGLRFTFKLMDETPNAMQDRTCTIDLKVMASQNLLAGMP